MNSSFVSNCNSDSSCYFILLTTNTSITLALFQANIFIISIVGVISCLINSLTLYVVKYKVGLKLPVFCGLANLAVANILLAIALITTNLLILIQHQYFKIITWINYTVCCFTTPLIIAAVFVINGSLLFIAIARYQKLTHSRLRNSHLANRQLICIFTLLWCIGLFFAFPISIANAQPDAILYLCNLLSLSPIKQRLFIIISSSIVFVETAGMIYCHYKISIQLSSSVSAAEMKTADNIIPKLHSSTTFRDSTQRNKDIILLLHKLTTIQSIANFTWLTSFIVIILGKHYIHRHIVGTALVIQQITALISSITSPILHIKYVQRLRVHLHSCLTSLASYLLIHNRSNRVDPTISS